ncbi:hypothetical protein [Lentilactobacillus laojiaonis]|uniref:hypothetical protein n=1 Tax=Lentilactobacillus laojiaonis TaxID=2883998 RepID=UPI001D0BA59C|nr:hypothetical protein [Lentilactobacillus laojiaonis]UDM32445.1 hypothetical protein LHL71_01550 [Lentilactobacillus laojiaonis]
MDSQSNYTALLNQLVNEEIDQFKITPSQFQEFQIAFMNFDKRKRVIGSAEKNGEIVYHL